MNNRVSEIYRKTAEQTASQKPKKENVSGKSFAEVLKESVAEVNRMQLEAEEALKALSTGKEQDIQKVMITLQKADVSLRMLMEVRNKAIEAYQEIMRMQV